MRRGGVKNPETFKPAANPLFGDRLKIPLRLLLVDRTRGLGLTIGATLGNRALASTPPHGDAVDDVALLGLVTQPACLVRPGWPRSAVHLGELAILPAPDAEQIAHHIALLF